MNIKKLRYGCHISHNNLDLRVVSKDIQVFYYKTILTVLSNGEAVVSIYNAKIKGIQSDYTIEVIK